MPDERRRRDVERDAAAEAETLGPGLVHEMRQPLTGVHAGLKLIARELGETVTGLEAWSLVTEQVARLDETLRTYGDLMDPVRREVRPYAVEPVVRQAVDLLRFRLRRLGERFSLVVEDGMRDAYGPPAALLHAVTNLLVNAIDALEEAGGAGRVEVRVRSGGGSIPRAEVRIADEGAGIAPAVAARIFDAHFTTKPACKGSGLGLTIARTMVRNFGGEVRLVGETDPDRRPWARTEFAIELPAGAADARPRLTSASPGRRRAIRAAAALGGMVLIASAILGGWAIFHRWVRGTAPATAATSTGAPLVPISATVVEVEGVLERRLGGDDWESVAPGERLRADDTIRTPAGARAVLAVGDASRIDVTERTELSVREITAAVQRLRLARGRIALDHQPDGARVLVIESERGDAVARTHGARFSILSTGAALSVATESGVVRLESGGAMVDVAAGQRSIAIRGAPPSSAAPIPVDVLLRVGAAAVPRDSGLCAIVRGKVDTGSEVLVDGRPVEVGPDGQFEVRVPRVMGHARARVLTRDVAGRVVQRTVPCVAGPGAEVKDFAVRWHDGAKPRAAR